MSTPRRRGRKTPAEPDSHAHLPPDGRTYAARLGEMIRERRLSLNMLQDDLALSTGVGHRFIIDLEAGKPGCHLGKSLLVANAVGLRILDIMQQGHADNAMLPDLPPDLPDPEPGR